LMKAFGMKIMAINTSGQTDESVEFIGTMADLGRVLSKSDVVVVSVPLTRYTKGLITKKELEAMKPDAILINPARGPIIEEKALYEHMVENPDFKVGIDAWWVEPHVHGEFKLKYPFFKLENILGSPHNTNLVPEIYPIAVRRAAENVHRFLKGEKPKGIVDPADYEFL
ncbi:MAG: NAD(P)-dependent oxidoreductase, partial [Thermovirgaceae bacterium]